MKTLFLSLAIAGGLVCSVNAVPTPYSSIFAAGEGFTFEFTLSPLTDTTAPPSMPSGPGGMIWFGGNIDVDSFNATMFRLEAFENSVSESPIFSRFVTYDPGQPWETEWAIDGAWQDLQGVFRLTVVSGVVDLFGGSWIGAQIPGANPSELRAYGRFYTAEEMFAPIPEPSTYMIGFMGLGALLLVRRRK